jgi:hypothetical protein
LNGTGVVGPSIFPLIHLYAQIKAGWIVADGINGLKLDHTVVSVAATMPNVVSSWGCIKKSFGP